MKEHGICAKCKKSVGCPYADDRITGCKNFVLEPELKLTNKEWLQTCDTEQLAEFLADKCNEVVETVLSDASCDIGDIDNDDYWYRQADFVEWLKEKHE